MTERSFFLFQLSTNSLLQKLLDNKAASKLDMGSLAQHHIPTRGASSSFLTLIAVWNNRPVLSLFSNPKSFKNSHYSWQPSIWLPCEHHTRHRGRRGFLSHPRDACAQGPQHSTGSWGSHLPPLHSPMQLKGRLAFGDKEFPLLWGGRRSPCSRQGERERRSTVISNSWSPVAAGWQGLYGITIPFGMCLQNKLSDQPLAPSLSCCVDLKLKRNLDPLSCCWLEACPDCALGYG